MSMISRTIAAGVTVTILALSSPAAFAAPVNCADSTGQFIGGSGSWAPASSNLANCNLAQGGTNRPYVLFSSATTNTVTLEFFNLTDSQAFFEYRIDGVATGATPHPVVTGSTIHSGVNVDNRSPTNVSYVLQLFNTAPGGYVDIRLALGGERDWDFNWTRFEAEAPAPVPLPAAAWLLLSGLGGLGLLRRRKAS